MTKSSSRAEDERREEANPSAVTKKHGGKVVESVAPEELESFNDSECKHEKLVRDPSEKDFNAFICANNDCHEVVLFNKTN